VPSALGVLSHPFTTHGWNSADIRQNRTFLSPSVSKISSSAIKSRRVSSPQTSLLPIPIGIFLRLSFYTVHAFVPSPESFNVHCPDATLTPLRYGPSSLKQVRLECPMSRYGPSSHSGGLDDFGCTLFAQGGRADGGCGQVRAQDRKVFGLGLRWHGVIWHGSVVAFDTCGWMSPCFTVLQIRLRLSSNTTPTLFRLRLSFLGFGFRLSLRTLSGTQFV
jgi:hypothetical protein